MIVSPAAGLDEHDAVFVRLDSPSLQRSQHWEAQRLAAAATWVLLGSYAGSGGESLVANQEALEVSGLDNFRDNFNGMVGVQKKKLVIQLTQLAPDDLKDIRLCFSGRFVPAPHGQPPTFLKTKLKVENLEGKHQDLFVPITFIGHVCFWLCAFKSLEPFCDLQCGEVCQRPAGDSLFPKKIWFLKHTYCYVEVL